ncbi:uncharacterized protein CIMG_01083 [Coccidioides immitis RS]|uniref:Uncharacterized protein n=4 Tax=Coccidioides immitis TaxID=5501 RepID=J3KIE1_COCIM|nr:uncharacterized protein CIMG_01083 [Coccidioides immitis RS]KMP01010.1 hypothetical protein CIRG_01150 [Coccidioides immitis RMSCC 2394]KMU72751.1 hypothetical protein CISG_03185 [Coccidioides immitis RMSCC 3703]KMU83523.1 hypothetical protein CIHG_01305 [Coccidioides immitis H538.4]TPX26050.1 hypothetical protein DIZ76_011509 [Coccidioides immitis]EAS35729.3 hypothetical protein CIMG_01083 [Coccidioides immitis RS]
MAWNPENMGSATVISKEDFFRALERDSERVHREIAKAMDSGRFNIQRLRTERNELRERVQELDTQINALVMEKHNLQQAVTNLAMQAHPPGPLHTLTQHLAHPASPWLTSLAHTHPVLARLSPLK